MSEKTLFITGASSGIGAATAAMAAAAGWNVALFARDSAKLAAVAEKIGARALAVPGDVGDLASVEAAVARTVGHFGQIDAGFANAGRVLKTSGTEQGDPEEWRAMVDVNVLGVLFTTRALLPALRNTRGTLVLTGSAAGRDSIKGSIYGATKWFVHGYAANMALEMRDWGGRCGVVAPGLVDTPLLETPMPSKLHPEDVAAAVMQMITADPRASIREIFVMPQF